MHVIARYIAVVLAKLCILDLIQTRSANAANTFCKHVLKRKTKAGDLDLPGYKRETICI